MLKDSEIKIKSNNLHFDAFICYSRKDKVFANKLKKALEKYKPPKELEVPQRALRVFLDESDMTGTEYYKAISEHLSNSTNLIVICTPDARGSKYVDDEIERFAQLHDAINIIPILLSGMPESEVDTGQDMALAFPESLIKAKEKPLAIEYRGFKASKQKINKGGFEGAWFTLLANLYGISRAEMEQREKNKQAHIRRITTGLVTTIMAALTTLLVIALWQRQTAVKQRNEALSTQSIFLARQSREQSALGRTDLAVKLALEALPLDLANPSRPYVPSAEMALYTAIAQQRFSSILETRGDDLALAKLSANGERVVTVNSGIGQHVRVWDTATAEPIVAHQHQDQSFSNLSISSDDRYLAVSHFQLGRTYSGNFNLDSIESFQNLTQVPVEIHIFDLESGRLLDRIGLEGFAHSHVAFSPYNNQLLASSDDRMVLMDILQIPPAARHPDDLSYFKTDKSMARMRYEHPKGAKVEYTVFDEIGRTTVFINKEGVGLIVDLSGEYAHRYIRDPKAKLVSVKLAPKGNTALALTDQGELLKVDLISGVIIGRITKPEKTKYLAAGFIEGESVIRAISDTGQVTTWQLDSLKQLGSKQWSKDLSISQAFMFNQASIAVICFKEGGAQLWDFNRNENHPLLGKDEAKLVHASANGDASKIVLAADDNIARVLDTKRRTEQTLLSTPEQAAMCAAFSPLGNTVAIGYKGGSIELRDSISHEIIWKKPAAHNKAVHYVNFSPKGDQFLSASEDNTAKVWQVGSDQPRLELTGHSRAVSFAIFSPEGSQVLTVSSDTTSGLWDAATGQRIFTLPLPKKHLDPIHNASVMPKGVFTKDGRYIITVTAGDGHNVYQPAVVWDRKTGRLLHELHHKGAIWGLSLAADDRHAVTTSYDHTAVVWEIATGAKINTYRGHNWTVTKALTYPDMKKMATASNDKMIRIWNYQTAATIHTLEGHTSGIMGFSLSPDGRLLASGDGDGNLHLWDAQAGILIRKFTPSPGVFIHTEFDKTGEKLVAVTHEGSVQLYNLPPSGQELINMALRQYPGKPGMFLNKEQRIRFSLEAR